MVSASIGGDYVDDDNDFDPDDVGNDDGNPSQPDGADCHGHGTHVAGIIGGYTYGVAKNAMLYGHRVLRCNGTGATSGIIAAIDAVTALPQRPAIINLSLGGGPSTALDNAVREAIGEGIVFAIAAGNSNADAQTKLSRARRGSHHRRRHQQRRRACVVFELRAGTRRVCPGCERQVCVLRQRHRVRDALRHIDGSPSRRRGRRPVSGAPSNESPAEVRDALVASATLDVVTGPGAGSPNLLLYAGVVATAEGPDLASDIVNVPAAGTPRPVHSDRGHHIERRDHERWRFNDALLPVDRHAEKQ